MKKILCIALLALCSIHLSATDLTGIYDKVELRALSEHESSVNIDYGIFYRNIPYKVFGVYGVIEGGEQSDLLGEVVLSAYSLGAIANVAGSRDNIIDIEKIEGLPLSSLCSNFHGAAVGGALIAGANAFYAVNSSGVAMKSTVTVFGTMLDLSYRRVKVKCLQIENPNWDAVWID